jgi:FtsZ-binding cell division protein ZapB
VDEIGKLEEKVDRLIALINELKHKVDDLDESQSHIQSRDREIKDKVQGLIEKIDSLFI